MALEGVRQLLPKLQAAGMAIPVPTNLEDLNNFSASQSVFEDLLTTHALDSTALNYQDADLRERIGEINFGEYDLPSSNAEGIRVETTSAFAGAAAKTGVTNVFSSFKPIETVKTDYVFLALDLLHIGQGDMAGKMAVLSGLDMDMVKNLGKLMLNKNALPTEDYLRVVLRDFENFGVDPSQVFKTHPYYFELGLMRASDSTSRALIGKTSKVFAEYYRRHGFPRLGDSWYKRASAQWIGKQPELVKIIKKLDPRDGVQLVEVLDLTDRISFPQQVINDLFSKMVDFATVEYEPKSTVLHAALYPYNPQVVKALLARGMDIDLRDGGGYTALQSAALHHLVPAAEALIALGANVNSIDKGGYTALHLAASSGSPEIIRLLLESGLDVDVKTKEGSTPLDLAVYTYSELRSVNARDENIVPYREVMDTLMENRANPYLIDIRSFYDSGTKAIVNEYRTKFSEVLNEGKNFKGPPTAGCEGLRDAMD